jgi:hypothetical protein
MTVKKKAPAKKRPAKKNAVVKKVEADVPALNDFAQDAGAGFENAYAQSYTIPYLIILQSNSPQIDDDDPKYIEGAKAGMLFNTVTQELWEEATIIPVHYDRRMVEWVPRDAGGGYRGDFAPDDPRISDVQRGDDGRFMLENGNFLNDTRYHFVMIVNDDGSYEPVVISLTSTQIKKSRGWMTVMNNLKLKGPKGLFTPPTFSHKYTVTTVGESNEKGNWKGWKFTIDSILTGKEMYLYHAAKEFREAISKGAAKVDIPQTESHDAEDDVAF